MVNPNDITEYISKLKAKIKRLSDILSKLD